MQWKRASCCTLISSLVSCTGAGSGPEIGETNRVDGVAPSGLIQASDGNFYGTTAGGGDFGLGTVFRLTPAGVEEVLYSFTGGTSDGENPQGLIQGSDGNFYGTTNDGGINACQRDEPVGYTGGPTGCGVVFRVTPSGAESIIYFFRGTDDGGEPNPGLAQASDGTLYGTTAAGGEESTDCGSDGCGTVFQIKPDGQESALYSFSGKDDGSLPTSVIVGADGDLYGTTEIGGRNDQGTIFQLTPAGAETVLYSFLGGSDGELPFGPLLQASNGLFYGAEYFGGEGHGAIFEMTPAGAKTTLYEFKGGSGDGAYPGPLTLGSDGSFYGTTGNGGNMACSEGCGTVFKFTLPADEEPIYLVPPIDGQTSSSPSLSNLIQGNDGYLYGTSNGDGQFGGGTVFRMSFEGVKTVIYSFGRNTS